MPTGLVAAVAALFGCRMTAVFSPRRKGSVESALSSTRMTVCASCATTVEMLSNTAFLALLVLPGALARSKLNFTVSAVRGAPSEKVTPLRSLKV